MGEDKKQDTSQKDRNEARIVSGTYAANGGKDSDRISAAKLRWNTARAKATTPSPS